MDKICEMCGGKTDILIEETEIFPNNKKKDWLLCKKCSEKFNDCDYVRCPICENLVLRDSMIFDGFSNVCENCYE
jgi:hypothetical protein